MPDPIIETPRLLLRLPIEADLDRWAEMMSDPVAARFIGGVQQRSVAWRSMAAMAGSWTLKGFGMLAVVEKASGRWVGRLGPWQPEGWLGTEIGWGLHPDAWGKGYATEGSAAAIQWAFDTLGWSEVIHCIHPDNVGSARVAERLGSSVRGKDRLPPPYEDQIVDIWVQTREQWEAGGRGRTA